MAPLHYAAKYGKAKAARLLVENGANPFLLGDGECLPLHFTVKYRPYVIANSATKSNDSKSLVRTNTVRTKTTECGYTETLKYLIQIGKEIEDEKKLAKKKQSGISLRIDGDNAEKMKNTSDDQYAFISQDDVIECAPLHYAVFRNNIEAATILLDNKANIDVADFEGQTPLHLAALNGNVEIFKLFFARGADVLLTENDGTTVLQLAAKEGHKKFAEEILDSFDKHENVKSSAKEVLGQKDKKSATVLHYAVEACDAVLMDFLLTNAKKQGLDHLVNETTDNGDTALHLAAGKGLIDVVKTLCNHGATVSVFNESNETPVFLASKRNHHETVSFLLEKYPNAVNDEDSKGRTPLLIAATNGHNEVAGILLKSNSDIRHRNKNEENLIYLASSHGYHEFVTYILKYCEDENITAANIMDRQNLHQYTALHIAVKNGHKS